MSWCKHPTVKKVGRSASPDLMTVTYKCVVCGHRFTETKQLVKPPVQEEAWPEGPESEPSST